jgi:hypothetical protein
MRHTQTTRPQGGPQEEGIEIGRDQGSPLPRNDDLRLDQPAQGLSINATRCESMGRPGLSIQAMPAQLSLQSQARAVPSPRATFSPASSATLYQ